jgi:uncharacterized membrane protein
MLADRADRPPLTRIVRAIRVRPRLVSAIIVGLAILAVAPWTWRVTTRLLAAWDIGIALYLGLALTLMRGAKVEEIRERSAAEDEGRVAVLVLSTVAALASLGAIMAEVGIAAGDRTRLALALAAVTIFLSWAFIHVVFALHYAHAYYDPQAATGPPCLDFPGDPAPVYSDFLYFAFVVGMTAQVSDVAVRDKTMRRTVTGHAIISFFFNAALLALVVNIAATAI